MHYFTISTEIILGSLITDNRCTDRDTKLNVHNFQLFTKIECMAIGFRMAGFKVKVFCFTGDSHIVAAVNFVLFFFFLFVCFFLHEITPWKSFTYDITNCMVSGITCACTIKLNHINDANAQFFLIFVAV